ncbi:probable carboxylesterase 13 [Aegilops tauschii subsp. strangulata]|uniref:probable carboxylesterase 13 n=1 Tax=Aegilops tauschii subsp. strangulata TaxID=200361 RepID=UPI00098B684A|nr:probable carboxylesterase 13 [Aegilops tauschii subsp. strangulata]
MDPDSEITGTRVAACITPLTGATSKDIHAGPARARVYLPPVAFAAPGKLPVVVYLHGCGFVIGYPARPSIHAYLNDLVAHSGPIDVSICYRLIRWRHINLYRVFLSGYSIDANIAHNMATPAGTDPLSDCELLILASDGLWDKVGNQEAVDAAPFSLCSASLTCAFYYDLPVKYSC